MILLTVTEIDLNPLFSQVVWPALSIVALALAGYIAKKIANKADADTQDKVRILVNNVLQSGLQAAQAKVASSNIERPNVQAGIIADALNYASLHGPEALKKLGIDMTTEAGQKEIYAKLQSMLAPSVMLAVASPNNVSVATAATALNSAVSTASPATAVPSITVDPANPVPAPAVAGPIGGGRR